MKKIFTVFVMLFALVTPCFAAEPAVEFEKASCETLSDGTIVETVLTVYKSGARANGRLADCTKTYKDSNGSKMAAVTLYADFGYDGTEAWVRSSYTDVTEYNGWTYGSERISESGGTARLSAKLTKSGKTSKSVSMSLTCSANGTIS